MAKKQRKQAKADESPEAPEQLPEAPVLKQPAEGVRTRRTFYDLYEPQFCPECKDGELFQDKRRQYWQDDGGKWHWRAVDLWICPNCGYTRVVDD